MSELAPKALHDTLLGQMAYSTVRIEMLDSARAVIGCSTGFIVQFERGELKVPLVITTRHLIEGAAAIQVQLHEQGPGSSLKTGAGRKVSVAGGSPVIFGHPNPEVDLAAIQLLHLTATAKSEGWTPFYRHLTRPAVADAAYRGQLEAVEDVYMVGYPNALFDSHNNLPLVRRGITATPTVTEYEGRPEFLVDMAVYEGSSGSPIFINKVSRFVNADGHLQENASIRLLGVLYGGHSRIESVRLGSDKATPLPNVAVRQMINVGVCIRAEVVLGFDVVVQGANMTPAPWEVGI